MPAKYFSVFPTINYSNVAVRDITKRVKITHKAFNTPTLFYPYEVKNATRPDVIAYTYYDDSYYDWLIYLTNQIVDPYYGWTLNDNDFNNFIIKKYGSLENATQKIKYYQTNWSDSDLNISTAYYESLPEDLKKYYSPNFGYNTKIISYKRRQEDWTVNTNKIISLEISLASSSPMFNVGELVTISPDGVNKGGAGEVVQCNSTTVIIKNISGNTSSNNYLSGDNSQAYAIISQSIKLSEPITDEEFSYWTPVSYFDYEKDKNESKKFINVIDANYSIEIYEELRKAMKS
jgi:hypothetical protein